MLLFAENAGNTHLILLVVFIVVMLLWLLAGVEWGGLVGPEPAYRRVGGGLLPWIAVAILGYLVLG